jgi:hypothetical protein
VTQLVRTYDDDVSGHERDARRARVAYLGAVRQLAQAMAEFERVEVPLYPGIDRRIPDWTTEQTKVMVACAAAWTLLVAQRRAYESAVRTAGHPETWPHA